MKFDEYCQNNTGGSFDVDEKVCHRVFIEDGLALHPEDLGIYFNGVEDGMDCPCCGDRWYSPDEHEFPKDYYSGERFNNVEDYAQMLADKYGWTKPDARIYYANGTVKEIFRSESS